MERSLALLIFDASRLNTCAARMWPSLADGAGGTAARGDGLQDSATEHGQGAVTAQ